MNSAEHSKMILTAIALVFCPFILGMLIGWLLRRLLGRRIEGTVAAIGWLMLPTAAGALFTILYPIVGLWDGFAEGFLFGIGALLTLHRLFSDPRDIGLAGCSVVLAFGLVELGGRLLYGSPPTASRDGPHLYLADALRLSAPDSLIFQTEGLPPMLAQKAMQGVDLAKRGEDTTAIERPPAVMLMTELVCSIAYGPAYHGMLDTSRERRVVFPERFKPRPDAALRVLHIGDSLVFGANTGRDQTFAALLDRMDPNVEHINGGISGTAPDDYLVVLQSWIARQKIDLAVMYLFEGNDIAGLDSTHPCSGWKSILVYEDGLARLRYPSAPVDDRGIGFWWLFHNSPCPYPVRVLIAEHSAAAWCLGSLLSLFTMYDWPEPSRMRYGHLEAILRTARDELGKRKIPFVVVMLPMESGVGPDERTSFSKKVHIMSLKLDLPVLYAAEPLREAISRGEKPFQDDHVHFNESGHLLMANWLYKHLAPGAKIPLRRIAP